MGVAGVSDVTIMQKVAEDHNVRSQEVVRGLDTLRFITATWVAFSHGARFPIERVIAPDNVLHKILYLLNNTTFNGTAAVSVFFVISGFLIHGANVGRSKIDFRSFWIRRGVRIGIPLIIVLCLANLFGDKYLASLGQVLWSVYAELIYYALYPFLFPFIIRFGIVRVLSISIAISLIIIITNPGSVYLWDFGHTLIWLFCFPLWLMGCFLAEYRIKIAKLSRGISPWFFRIGALGYCYISTILATHLEFVTIGYTWTIWFFGIWCIFWIDSEMVNGTGRAVNPLLERFGTAGYSLYLVHKFILTFMAGKFLTLDPFYYWIVALLGVFTFTWLFYRCIEWPSHKIARFLGRRPKISLETP